MEIRSLELENVKSYERETIAFARGTNAICGPNGAGKSTILEAIGYALFDEAPCRPINNLVREGCQTATITVTLSAADEREYQVVRKCGVQHQYYVYDPELGQRIAAGPDDVLSWLKEQLGVEEAADLGALFRDAVGVPQGLLTAAFLQTAKNRQATFNPLLRVEEYNKAFADLLETRRALDTRIQGQEAHIAGLQARVEALPALEQEAAGLAHAISEAEAQLAQLSPELAALEQQRAAFEEAQERLRTLEGEAARLDGEVTGLQGRVDQAQAAVTRAQAAQTVLLESEPGHRAYLAAQERLQVLEAQERDRSSLQQRAHDIRARQQVAIDRVQRLEREVARALAAKAEATRLEPAVQEQERIEAEWHKAQTLAAQWEPAARRLKQERARLAQLAERLAQTISGIEERARLELKRHETKEEIEALEESLRTLRADQARQVARLEQLHAQAEALSHLETARCPVCEGDLPPERRTALLEGNRDQSQMTESLLAELRKQEADLVLQQQSAVQTLQAMDKQIARLPRPEERESLEADCRRQKDAIYSSEEEVARFEAARARLQSIEIERGRLGDPRTAYQQALALAAQQAALAADLERERSAAAALAADLATLDQQLATYSQLDAEMADVRAALGVNESAHQRFLRYQLEAEALPQRLAELDASRSQLASVQARRRALEAELQAAEAAYRREEHERVSAAYLRASEERGRLEERLENQRSRLLDCEARVEELRSLAAKLEVAQGELATWRDVGQLLDYLRRVLRDAGPQVTKALVQAVSLQAARLYSDIISDSSGRLRWSEDYEILVEHGGYDRTFQQLSGGEQMAAALAVRLALLREISDIDVAFFDEPTSNLDETRRDNLADQILAVKGFSQLFVVSHDDTFERATDHVIRIAKENGTSKVVA